ncbi:MAG: YfhO family protein, partial [Actinobacteria bacterium]|nr:YfhO family protein [Actinomycetota bacterium]
MNKIKNFWPLILIGIIVLLFFFPIFKGNMPFPGDLLVNSNPYSSQSFLGYNPGGYPNKAQGADVITEIYPWRHFSIDQIKQGEIPFWNPHNFSGNPQIANFQTALFYPLNILYLILPFNLSWTLIIMLQPFLAGIFMFLFLKKGVGLKDFASFIGAVSFSFSSYMSVWIQYGNIGSTLLWLPLILLLIKNFVSKITALNFLILSLSLCMSFLAGYIQGVFYIYILSFLYYLYLVLQEKKKVKNLKKHILFLVAILTPVLITFFQILPTIQLFSDSTRGAYTLSQIEKNLSPIMNWITIVFPDFFGNPATRNYWLDGTYIERVLYPGSVVLLFAVFSVFNKIKITERKFFLVVGIISLVIATNFPFVKYLYLIPIAARTI